MKKHVAALAVAVAGSLPLLAVAQTPAAPAKEEPDFTVTGNMTIASDYRFRGISQTFAGNNFWGPAIQGGIDLNTKSGFYVGNWNSNVSGNQYPNGSSIEMDFYGGYKMSFGDVGLDLGTIYYYYPGSRFLGDARNAQGVPTGATYDQTIYNWEIYIGASWKFLSAKYYYTLSDFFGITQDVASNYSNKSGTAFLGPNGNTKGSQYLTVAGTYEVAPKWNVFGSVGYTWVTNYGSQLNYLDYKLGVSYDIDGWVVALAGVGTNADSQWWYAVNGAGTVRELGKFNAVVSVTKTF
jgi:uncharacterized protein (TIGR02001 family)